MVPEKLGMFRKFLAKLGKRAYWTVTKKMNLWMLSSMAYGVTKKYEEIFEGDTGMAVDTFTEQFVNGANSIMYELLGTMKIFFSKSLEDVDFLAETALHVILGSKWPQFFGKPKMILAENTEEGVAQLVMRFPRCVLCTGLRPGIDVDHTKLRKNSYGELLARALVALMQLIQDYVGNKYKLVVKETKCRLRGDPYGEGISYYYPKDE
ncbi:MAG TPA: hypothetical protein VMV49_00045 [Candidatus Deferrimicrobium sp.]|nr:hypothetical protein [Candidatus Deferrimicrobium sp.]